MTPLVDGTAARVLGGVSTLFVASVAGGVISAALAWLINRYSRRGSNASTKDPKELDRAAVQPN